MPGPQPDSVCHIAGLNIPLHDVGAALADLAALYADFDARGAAYAADPRNPHLCRAGCSHCCRSGAIFAVTLVEAVAWAQAIAALPAPPRSAARGAAQTLLDHQPAAFGEVAGPPDAPGAREDALFTARVARLNAAHPACPLLADDLCSVYAARPLLCRAYGFPVDAFAVAQNDALVFRSLCTLYADHRLVDYVRARDVKARLADLSRRIAGGCDWGRFTSCEAILAEVDQPNRLLNRE